MTKLIKPLPKKDQAKLEKRFPHWKIAPDFSRATLTIVFTRHVDAIVFIARLGIYAEVHQHHPEMQLTQAKIKLTVSTSKQLTAPDVLIMKHVDELLKGGDKGATMLT